MIDPNHLRTLRALADHGTVVAAAETLHLSPSAVSQQLNSLARTTGCTLLEKRGRGVVLTQPAKILLEHADAILERFEQAESDMRSYQQGDAAVLRIGGFSSVLQSFVSEAVSTALHRNPGWSIQIDEVESEESMAMLLDRELDVSVVMIAPNRPLLADRRISLDPLLADTYRAVVPAVHPLGALDELDRLSRLAYEPWVLSRHWTSTHEIVMAACAVAGFQPRAAHNTTDFAASVAMVGHGLGVSVIPMLGLPRLVPDAVKILPIRVDPPTRHIAVAVRSGSAQPGSPLAQFRDLLKQTVSHLAEPTTLTNAVAGVQTDTQPPKDEDDAPDKPSKPGRPTNPIEIGATKPSEPQDARQPTITASTQNQVPVARQPNTASRQDEVPVAHQPTTASTQSETPIAREPIAANPESDASVARESGAASEPSDTPVARESSASGEPSGACVAREPSAASKPGWSPDARESSSASRSGRLAEAGMSNEVSESSRTAKPVALKDTAEPHDANATELGDVAGPSDVTDPTDTMKRRDASRLRGAMELRDAAGPRDDVEQRHTVEPDVVGPHDAEELSNAAGPSDTAEPRDVAEPIGVVELAVDEPRSDEGVPAVEPASSS